MKDLIIKGFKKLSKTDQKSILGGDHSVCCYKACVNSGYTSAICQDVCFS